MNRKLIIVVAFICKVQCSFAMESKVLPDTSELSFSDWYARIITIPYLREQQGVTQFFERFLGPNSDQPFVGVNAEEGVKRLYTRPAFQQLCKESKKATWDEFEQTIDNFLEYSGKSGLTDKNSWTQNGQLSEDFFDVKKRLYEPYTVGLHVKPGSPVYFIPDMHAGARSTLCLLEKLRQDNVLEYNDGFTIKDNNHIVCLGDYVNRGVAGVEALITVLQLKLKNPDNVFLIRGNHEDAYRPLNQYYFQKEIEIKYQEVFEKFPEKQEEINQKIARVYDCFAQALFIGSGKKAEKTDYLVACHGFLSLGYNPKTLFQELAKKESHTIVYDSCAVVDREGANPHTATLLKNGLKENQEQYQRALRYLSLKKRAEKYEDTGFMYSHIIADSKDSIGELNPQATVLKFGKKLADTLLDEWKTESLDSEGTLSQHRPRWVVRGHQHPNAHEYVLYKYITDQLLHNNGISEGWKDDQRQEKVFLLPPDRAYYTLLAAPDSEHGVSMATAFNITPSTVMYPGFKFGTCFKVIPGASKKEWIAQKINISL